MSSPRARDLAHFWLILALAPGSPLRGAEPWQAGFSEVLFSEIHYHPAQDEGDEEFVELFNAGIRHLDLGGWRLSGGVELTLPERTILPPGEHLVLAANAERLKAAHQIANVVGNFKGNLSNTGETLELHDAAGALVQWIAYGDGGREDGFWPDRADGEGPSCELLFPHPDGHRSWYWKASLVPGGTPGRENSRTDLWRRAPAGQRPSPPDVRINEVRLARGDPLVELWSEAPGAVKLDGLALTRDPLGRGGVSLQGSLTRRKPLALPPDSLRPLASGGGKLLYLVRAESREILDSFSLSGDTPATGSRGRWPDGGPMIATAPRTTPGAPNLRPPQPELVINEVLYHGPVLAGAPRGEEKDAELEFVELFNRGKAAVSLRGWKLDRSVSFTFPDDVSIPAGGYVVVTNAPPALKAGLGPAEARGIQGPFKGKLKNSEGTIALVDANGDTVDRVHYEDRLPWPRSADSGGTSLELLHPDLDNRWAQAWAPGPNRGTPLRKNARSIASMAPILAGVRVSPAAPAPDEDPVVHANVIDTAGGAEVSVVYRDLQAGGNRAARKSLLDNGNEDDGAPRDGHFAGKLPRLRPGGLLGFYVQVKDSSGKTSRFPEGDRELFLRGDAPRGKPGPPVLTYDILTAPSVWEQFERTNHHQDTTFPCTLAVTFEAYGLRSTRAFHGARIRYRGNNSRNPPDGRMSYRVVLQSGDAFDGRDKLILNAYSPLRQKVGGDLLRAAGVLTPDVALVTLRTPGGEDPRYCDVEVVNGDFLTRRFGSAAGGIYRGRGQGAGGADLSYRGADVARYSGVYDQVNRRAEVGLQDLIKALQALSAPNSPTYLDDVERAIDLRGWAAYFAANHAVLNDENGLSKGVADDYFVALRPTDEKLVLIAWDHDTVLSKMRYEPIFGPSVPAVRRLLATPRFAALYHEHLRRMAQGPMSRAGISFRLRALEGSFTTDELRDLERACVERSAAVAARYRDWPRVSLESGEGDPVESCGVGTRLFLPRGKEGLSLAGRSDPASIQGVRILGVDARRDLVTGRWTLPLGQGVAEKPGALWIELLGPKNDVVDRQSVQLLQAAEARLVTAQIGGNVEWSAGGGPYVLSGVVQVPQGSSLKIGPGADVIGSPGALLDVRGTLLIEGTALEPVSFRCGNGGAPWWGLRLARGSGGGEGHRLAHVRFEGGAPARVAGNEGGEPGFLSVQGARVTLEVVLLRGIDGLALAADGARATLRSVRIFDSRSGASFRGGSLSLEGCELARLREDGLQLSGNDLEASLSRSTVREVGGIGISVEAAQAAITGTLIHGCGAAVALSLGAKATGDHLTLADSGVAVVFDPQKATRRGGRVIQPTGGRSSLELKSSVVGVHERLVQGNGSIAWSHGVVAPPIVGEGAAGEGVIVALPRFLAPDLGDFHLAPESPGKGSAGATDPGIP